MSRLVYDLAQLLHMDAFADEEDALGRYLPIWISARRLDPAHGI